MQDTFQDRELNCVECGETFVFSGDEQQLFATRGYTNDPKRCLPCRQARRSQRRGGGVGSYDDRAPRQMFPAVCAQCGKDCEVPFQPRGDRPVYCDECYRQARAQQRY